jgi:phosphohistidine phosphatase
MGAHLADLGFAPDVALVSAAMRTRESWAAVQSSFPNARVQVEDDLYHADSGAVRHAAEKAGKTARTVMVVGHNPGLQELAVRLLTEGGAPPSLVGKAARQFPTAAAAVFLFDDNGRPAFDGLFFPDRD